MFVFWHDVLGFVRTVIALCVLVVQVGDAQRARAVHAFELACIVLVIIRFIRVVLAIVFPIVDQRQSDDFLDIEARVGRCLRLGDRVVGGFVIASRAIVLPVVHRGKRDGVA